MASETKSILLVGVGGQGTILASRILSEGLMAAGFDVKMSEIHGMAQRGGSVSTHVRYGKKVYSPVISPGEADVLVAFEKVEALRWLLYLAPGGRLVVNDTEIFSLPVLLGQAKYPERAEEALAERVREFRLVDAAGIAGRLGNPKAQNVVLLGALVRAMALESVPWKDVMKGIVPPKLYALNEKAFDAGLEA
jgi:indolepyruvate ferredoxin oxidoreductase beta subunit